MVCVRAVTVVNTMCSLVVNTVCSLVMFTVLCGAAGKLESSVEHLHAVDDHSAAHV